MALLIQSTKRSRRRNCTPSRTRKLLTYYQWMESNYQGKPAVQMSENGKPRHNEYDTVALANFLNGKVAIAIDFQKRAIKMGGDGQECRRRLRVYEATAKSVREQRSLEAIPTGIGGSK